MPRKTFYITFVICFLLAINVKPCYSDKPSNFITHTSTDNVLSNTNTLLSKDHTFLGEETKLPSVHQDFTFLQAQNPARLLAVTYNGKNLRFTFLVKFWDQFLTLIIATALAFIFAYCEKISDNKDQKTFKTLFGALRSLTKWNFILVLIGVDIEDIILYSSMEYRNLNMDSGISVFSFLLSLVALGVSLAFIICTFLLLRKAQEAESSEYEKAEFLSKWEGFQVLFTGSKTDNLHQRLFYLIYLGRRILSSFFGAVLYSAPVAQAVLQMLLSMAIIGYILYKRPLKKLINLIQLVVIESILLLLNILTIALLAKASDGQWESESVYNLASAIIIGNFIISILLIIFLVAKLVLEAMEIYKYQQESEDVSNLVWLQLLTILLNQGGLGIEDMRIPEYNPDAIQTKGVYQAPANKSRDEYDPRKPKSHSHVVSPSEIALGIPDIEMGERDPTPKDLDSVLVLYPLNLTLDPSSEENMPNNREVKSAALSAKVKQASQDLSPSRKDMNRTESQKKVQFNFPKGQMPKNYEVQKEGRSSNERFQDYTSNEESERVTKKAPGSISNKSSFAQERTPKSLSGDDLKGSKKYQSASNSQAEAADISKDYAPKSSHRNLTSSQQNKTGSTYKTDSLDKKKR